MSSNVGWQSPTLPPLWGCVCQMRIKIKYILFCFEILKIAVSINSRAHWHGNQMVKWLGSDLIFHLEQIWHLWITHSCQKLLQYLILVFNFIESVRLYFIKHLSYVNSKLQYVLANANQTSSPFLFLTKKLLSSFIYTWTQYKNRLETTAK